MRRNIDCALRTDSIDYVEDSKMKKYVGIKLGIFILILFISLPVNASNIVEIAVATENIPFLLDDKGQVWAFRKPLSFEEPIKLPNLNHIKKIVPYIAVDTSGQVFTWSLNAADSQWDESGISKATYTAPQRVENLKGVTSIAYSDMHFVAVIEDRDIVDWEVLRDPRSFRVIGYGPIHTIISRKGVRAVAVASRPKVMSITGTVYKPATESLVALFDDGTVMGWGITPTGRTTEDATWQSVLLTKLLGATDIAMNLSNIVILSADGVPRYWGGCDLYGKNANGQSWSPGSTERADGYVADVIGMAISQGNDYVLPDAFIKQDGSVWAAYAPLPPSASGKECLKSEGDKRRAWKLTAGSAVAIQVVGGDPIFMLDAEHKFWTTAGSWMNSKLHYVPINLQ
jgi:hypothetical protein